MDKLEILLDMIEHPERYTEQQINELLADDEMRKHYDVMVRLRGAYDVKRGAPLLTPQAPLSAPPQGGGWNVEGFKKIAAIFLAAAFLTGLAWALVPRLLSPQANFPQPTKVSTPLSTREGQGGGSSISFSNLRLDSILTVVAAHYDCEVCFRDSAAAAMKFITTWNPEDPVAAFIDHLNMFDGLRLTLRNDTIFVESTNDEEGAQ